MSDESVATLGVIFPQVGVPSEVNHEKIVAGFINPMRAGERPNGTALVKMSHPTFPDTPYTVWNIGYTESLLRWDAFEGDYDMTLEQAWAEFTRRAYRLRAS